MARSPVGARRFCFDVPWVKPAGQAALTREPAQRRWKLRRLSLTNDAQQPLSSADRRSLDRGTTGNAVRKPDLVPPFNAAAAPATVSGEPVPQSHWENPGRRCRAATREPGDLPSIRA
jgi:hypothetical protein